MGNPFFGQEDIMCGCYYCRDGGFYKLCMRIDAEYKWNAIAYFPTNENVRAYKDLMPILGDDPYFYTIMQLLFMARVVWKRV